MSLEIPKLSRDQALDLLRRYPSPKGTPEQIVDRWEKFTLDIPVGTTVTNVKDPTSRAVTMEGKYYNSPADSYLSVFINNAFRGTWLVDDTKKVDDQK